MPTEGVLYSSVKLPPRFRTPSFGIKDVHLSSYAMTSESDLGKTHLVQQQHHPAQHQQEHMYSQLAHHQPMAAMDINLNQPMAMSVSECGPSMTSEVSALGALAPKFPPQNFDVPDISLSNSVTAASEPGLFQHNVTDVLGMNSHSNPGVYYNSVSSAAASGQMPPPQSLPVQQQLQQRQASLSTISHSHVAGQLGFQSMRTAASPAGSHTSSPGRESSEDSDDSLPLAQLVSMKRAAAGVSMPMDTSVSMVPSAVPAEVLTPQMGSTGMSEGAGVGTEPPTSSPAKKQKGGKKKKKKDPNEPQKPVSAYALFFRDTQAAIKGQNPSASFGEVSKIVASMWDGLDPMQKEVYKKRTEAAKKEYLKQLAAYRASQVSQSAVEEAGATAAEKSPSPPSVQSITISPASGQGPTAITLTGMRHMQQHQQQLQQQAMPQHSAQQSGMQHFTSVDTQPKMSSPLFQTSLSPQPVMDPVLSSAHDNGLFPQSSVHESPSNLHVLCVRDGCQNMAIENPSWDAEYCSNECVVTHCRDIFTAWVASRGGNSTYPVK